MKTTLSLIALLGLAQSSSAFELVLGAPKTEALAVPFCIDFDEAGNLYGVEFEPGHRVFRLDTEGRFAFLGGQKGVVAPKEDNGKGDGGPISEALFSGMHDLAVTRAGKVYLADSWVGRVRLHDPATGLIETVAGTGRSGSSGDGGPATEADFRQIFACALSPDESRLHLVDIASRRVRYLDLRSGKVEAFAGTGEKGRPVDGEPALGQPLQNPRAVAVDPRDGSVYLVDRDGHSLIHVDTEGRLKTVVNVSGQKGATGDGGKAIEATLNGPKHAIVDGKGRVVIADAENHTIRRYDPATGLIELIAGTPGKVGDDLSENAVLLNRPHGVRLSRDGAWLYIVDSYNDRVLRMRYE